MEHLRYEVIVAGGGPGGSTMAGRLAQRGRRVLVLEKALFPRFHLGESLLPRSLEVLDALGVRPKLEAMLLRKYGARFIDGEHGDEVAFRFEDAFRPNEAYAFQGSRADIDATLLEHAASLGAEVRHGWDVVRLLWEGTRAVGVLARDPHGVEHTIASRVVVDATGRDALSSRAAGARSKVPKLTDTLALYCQLEGCARLAGRDEGDIRIVLVPEGWFWIIPFRGDLTSVGVVLKPSVLARGEGEMRRDLTATFDGLCRKYPLIAAIVGSARPVMPVGAAADFSYRVKDLAGDGWLAVGDAAGFIDPLFSTGFHLAVKGADLAAAAIHDALVADDVSRARWAIYETQRRRAFDAFLGLVQAFYGGELIPLLFASQQRAILRRMITSLLAGDVFHEEDPRWLRDLVRRYPAAYGLGEGAEKHAAQGTQV